MRQFLLAAACSLTLLLAPAASRGADLDMRSFTCADFEKLDQKSAETMIVWLVGWYAGYGETYKFGDKAMDEAVKVLSRSCDKDREARLMKVMKNWLDDE